MRMINPALVNHSDFVKYLQDALTRMERQTQQQPSQRPIVVDGIELSPEDYKRYQAAFLSRYLRG